MHQTKTGNEWKVGIKCHMVMDTGSALVLRTEAAANGQGMTQATELLCEDDEVAYGASKYIGLQKDQEQQTVNFFPRLISSALPDSLPNVSDIFSNWSVLWRIASLLSAVKLSMLSVPLNISLAAEESHTMF